MIDKCKGLFEKYRETILYLIAGVATTVVNWVAYALLLRAFDDFHHSVFLANTLAWGISLVFAYVVNKIWVFESYSWEIKYVAKELSLFVSARVLTGLLEIFGVPFVVDTLGFDMGIFGVRGMVAKILVGIIVIITNYVLSKFFIFKKEEQNEV